MKTSLLGLPNFNPQAKLSDPHRRTTRWGEQWHVPTRSRTTRGPLSIWGPRLTDAPNAEIIRQAGDILGTTYAGSWLAFTPPIFFILGTTEPFHFTRLTTYSGDILGTTFLGPWLAASRFVVLRISLTTYYLLLTTYYLLLTTCYSLLTTFYLLFTTYCPLQGTT